VISYPIHTIIWLLFTVLYIPVVTIEHYLEVTHDLKKCIIAD